MTGAHVPGKESSWPIRDIEITEWMFNHLNDQTMMQQTMMQLIKVKQLMLVFADQGQRIMLTLIGRMTTHDQDHDAGY